MDQYQLSIIEPIPMDQYQLSIIEPIPMDQYQLSIIEPIPMDPYQLSIIEPIPMDQYQLSIIEPIPMVANHQDCPTNYRQCSFNTATNIQLTSSLRTTTNIAQGKANIH